MKVLITGANGYIGTRLLPVLLEKNHEIVCLVRDERRFKERSDFGDRVKIITGDLLKEVLIEAIPPDIDAAYYLAHSVADTPEFTRMEALSAHNFVQALNHTNCKQIIFLSRIVNAGNPSNHHYTLHKYVEDVLREANAALTVLRASIIVGSGSPSFEIICDLAEKLAVMTAPRWAETKFQPIAISDVLAYLEGVLLNAKAFGQTFDIGGPDKLSFKDLMLIYARVRKLNRKIILPFLSPKLSSYWLYLVTPTSYQLAQSLVDSMMGETIMHDNRIDDVVPHKCLPYEEALNFAFCSEKTIS
jgi:uncharacterized protein YbjT (DUF2867 family)